MTSQLQYAPEEIARRGQEIYDRQFRRLVEPANEGRFIVIDILSGDHEIDDDDLAASDRVLARHRDAILYGVRIGHSVLT